MNPAQDIYKMRLAEDGGTDVNNSPVPPPPANLATIHSESSGGNVSDASRRYSGAEKRVLEHAADILGVPYETLIAMNPANSCSCGVFQS